jgi:hypothetical protein
MDLDHTLSAILVAFPSTLIGIVAQYACLVCESLFVARDTQNASCRVRIHDSVQEQVYVHYLGWSDRWNTWLPRNHLERPGAGNFSPHPHSDYFYSANAGDWVYIKAFRHGYFQVLKVERAGCHRSSLLLAHCAGCCRQIVRVDDDVTVWKSSYAAHSLEPSVLQPHCGCYLSI